LTLPYLQHKRNIKCRKKNINIYLSIWKFINKRYGQRSLSFTPRYVINVGHVQVETIYSGERWKQSNGWNGYRKALHNWTIASEKLRLLTYGESHGVKNTETTFTQKRSEIVSGWFLVSLLWFWGKQLKLHIQQELQNFFEGL